MTRCSKREWWLILPYSYIPKQHGTFESLYHEINFETHSEHRDKPLQSHSDRKIIQTNYYAYPFGWPGADDG